MFFPPFFIIKDINRVVDMKGGSLVEDIRVSIVDCTSIAHGHLPNTITTWGAPILLHPLYCQIQLLFIHYCCISIIAFIFLWFYATRMLLQIELQQLLFNKTLGFILLHSSSSGWDKKETKYPTVDANINGSIHNWTKNTVLQIPVTINPAISTPDTINSALATNEKVKNLSIPKIMKNLPQLNKPCSVNLQ